MYQYTVCTVEIMGLILLVHVRFEAVNIKVKAKGDCVIILYHVGGTC
jgi:hypothetical protein